ncbi:tRNA-specific adenosine deaminase subunit tad3 [Schizosaccharomyces pombe]
MVKTNISKNSPKEATVPESDWPFKLIKSHLETRKLETENVWIACFEPKYASKVTQYVKQIRSKQKESLLHCNRLRRIQDENGSLELQIIICPEKSMTANEIGKDFEDLGIVSKMIFLYAVPAFPPLTDEQFHEWNSVWPVSYRKHVQRQDVFTVHELKRIESILEDLIKAAGASHKHGEIGCAAAIYDPTTDTVLAVSVDERSKLKNPINHCVMNAINLVAKRELSRRQNRTDGSEDRYLCKDLTVVMTHEPCVMCSMGLLHSRIRRLIYCKKQPLTGGIESLYGIHWRAELNHRYLAYSGWNKPVPSIKENIHV